MNNIKFTYDKLESVKFGFSIFDMFQHSNSAYPSIQKCFHRINRTRPKSYNRNKYQKRPFLPGNFTNFSTFFEVKIS